MGFKDILILVTLCMITNSTCCEEQKVVACLRQNMTCLKSLCSCTSNNFNSGIAYSHVTCLEVTEVPKEIPNEVYTM